MSQIRCLIVDDEPFARQLISEYAEKVPFLEIAGVCKSAWEAVELLKKQSVDLLLLDIEMPAWDGISFLQTWTSAPKAIFITAHRDYAVKAFELEVVDYLLKPVSFERFLKGIHRFQQLYQTSTTDFSDKEVEKVLFIRHNREMVRIYHDEILYLEVMGDYVKVVRKDGQKPVSKTTLKELMRKLPVSEFLQIHRSFVVAIDKVEAFKFDKVKVGDQWITISRPYRDRVKEVLGI